MSKEDVTAIIICLVIFCVAPVLVVWRLSRRPVAGDVPMKLTLRGMVAGVAGGFIGSTVAALLFRPQAYDVLGYLYLSLVFMPFLGIVFALILGAVQRRAPRLGLPGRAAVGALLGALTAFVWTAASSVDFIEGKDSALKGPACVVISTGVVTGILSGPLKEEETESDAARR